MLVQDDRRGEASGSSSPEQLFTAPSWHSTPSRRPLLAPEAAAAPPRRTLQETSADLLMLFRIFVPLLPNSLRRLSVLVPRPFVRLARFLAFRVAASLHKRNLLGTNIVYDTLVVFWKTVVTLFFREIESRSAWRIPKEGDGAVIFVCGPHSNQFVDGLLLMSEVRRNSGRRISFLMAEKSMNEPFIGGAAKLMQSIPVVRPQDIAKPGPGTIALAPDDPLIVLGVGTSFMADFEPKKKILLGKAFGGGTGDVAEVLDDNRLRLVKPFSAKTMEALSQHLVGAPYKILPHVDQSEMYASVFRELEAGGSLGIFPEGGSHDRTTLLPLKAGVSIMALGALEENPSLQLKIVPVGLSYFHPQKFRSRAVVEFGSPIEIPREMIDGFTKGGVEKHAAVSGVMALIVDGLKSVTVRAPDYETLMLIQATRRLYRPPGQRLSLGQTVALTRRFAIGLEVYKDTPEVKSLVARMTQYNTLLRYMGLKDHQVVRVVRPLWYSILLFLYRVGLLLVWGVLALPGVILNAPIFIAARVVSRRKAREALAGSSVKIKGTDVVSTWKILIALAGAPALYSVYAIFATFLAIELDLPFAYRIWAPIVTFLGLPLIGYSALKFGEVGMDVYKSLPPLFLSIIPGRIRTLDKLRALRVSLQGDISSVVNEFGPKLFEDFQDLNNPSPKTTSAPERPERPKRTPSSSLLHRRRSSHSPQGQGTFLTHPMSWVDEALGWHTGGDASGRETPSGAMTPGLPPHDAPDYEEVVHLLAKHQGEDE